MDQNPDEAKLDFMFGTNIPRKLQDFSTGDRSWQNDS
jgi:hypothetical protein